MSDYYDKFRNARDADIFNTDWFVQPVHKFGINPSVGTSEEVIIPTGTYTFPSSATTVRVKAGGNAADDAAGTGARTLRVEGLDSNYDYVYDDLTLAGISASSYTTQEFIRVNRAYVLTCGSGGENAAAINIEDESANVLAYIDTDHGQTEQLIFSVPRNYTCFLAGAHFHASYNKPSSVEIYHREQGGPWKVALNIDELQGSYSVNLDSAFPKFPEKSDIWVKGAALSGTSSISGSLELVLVYKN